MHNFTAAFFLAFSALRRSNRWALLLIIVVMALSFTNLIFISSIMTGFIAMLDKQLIETRIANVVIDPAENEHYFDNADQIAFSVRHLNGITGAAVHLNSAAFFEYRWKEKDDPSDKGQSGNWPIIGVDPEYEVGVTVIGQRLIAGEYLSPEDRDAILLGVEIAGGPEAQSAEYDTLGGVAVGDIVRLSYPNGVMRDYYVKGIFLSKDGAADRMSFVTRAELVSVMGRSAFKDQASQIIVRTAVPGAESVYVQEIRKVLEGIADNVQIRTWHDYGGGTRAVVASFDMVATLISGIGLFVAAIVMFIVLYIQVVNKRRQIGILRAIGISSRLIVGSYLVQAAFYVVSGILVGWLIYTFGIELYFINNPLDTPMGPLSLVVERQTVFDAVIGLVVAAFLAGLLPVLSLLRQDIIQTIWGNA
jgi:putative ABC transport system permease protein